MISKELETTLNTALREAKRRRHEYVCLEHLLYALLQDKDASAAILNCGGDLERLKKALEEFFTGQLETLPEGLIQEPQQTLGFHRVLQRAVIHAQSAEKKEITGGNMLIAMIREPDLCGLSVRRKKHYARRCGVLRVPRHLEDLHRR
jgi:ATP-dependent Clp protease ATP-binding subunit ClpA